MSQETRAVALAHAITFHAGKAGLAGVLEAATTFNNFLNADSGVVLPNPVVTKEAEVNEAPAPKKAGRPPKAEKAEKAEKAAPEPEVEKEPEGPTKEDVGKTVEAMLAANKRKEAIDLMKKYKATSVSSLGASDYAAFIEDCESVLMSA